MSNVLYESAYKTSRQMFKKAEIEKLNNIFKIIYKILYYRITIYKLMYWKIIQTYTVELEKQ